MLPDFITHLRHFDYSKNMCNDLYIQFESFALFEQNIITVKLFWKIHYCLLTHLWEKKSGFSKRKTSIRSKHSKNYKNVKFSVFFQIWQQSIFYIYILHLHEMIFLLAPFFSLKNYSQNICIEIIRINFKQKKCFNFKQNIDKNTKAK